MMPRPAFDDRDAAILERRTALLDADDGPRVGDYVRFADGVLRRISYLWPDGAQTSDGGSYYLGDGYVSMSGSLHPCVPLEALARTDEARDGSVWFFHHDYATADNGVGATVRFRVYECAAAARPESGAVTCPRCGQGYSYDPRHHRCPGEWEYEAGGIAVPAPLSWVDECIAKQKEEGR